jgi:hypothetical protein
MQFRRIAKSAPVHTAVAGVATFVAGSGLPDAILSNAGDLIGR